MQKPTEAFFDYSMEELLRDHAVFVQTTDGARAGAQRTGVSLQSRVTELETEVGMLKDQLSKAKGINDAMWETVVQRLVSQGKEKQQEQETAGVNGAAMDVDAEDQERRRKRSRA